MSSYIGCCEAAFSANPVGGRYISLIGRKGVLENSLVLIPGIGPGMERRLWRSGITDLDRFISAKKLPGISMGRLLELQERARVAKSRLQASDCRWIARVLPSRERWRILSLTKDRIASLDIECARIGNMRIPVIVSVCRPREGCTTLVRGEDLYRDRLDRLLSGTEILLTFNGSSFDLPLLAERGFRMDRYVHIDLRRYSRRAGLSGGLKNIERSIGIRRPRDLEYSTESQASYLWNLWVSKGNCRALDLLIRYNRQDAESLLPISNVVYRRLREKTLISVKKDFET